MLIFHIVCLYGRVLCNMKMFVEVALFCKMKATHSLFAVPREKAFAIEPTDPKKMLAIEWMGCNDQGGNGIWWTFLSTFSILFCNFCGFTPIFSFPRFFFTVSQFWHFFYSAWVLSGNHFAAEIDILNRFLLDHIFFQFFFSFCILHSYFQAHSFHSIFLFTLKLFGNDKEEQNLQFTVFCCFHFCAFGFVLYFFCGSWIQSWLTWFCEFLQMIFFVMWRHYFFTAKFLSESRFPGKVWTMKLPRYVVVLLWKME